MMKSGEFSLMVKINKKDLTGTSKKKSGKPAVGNSKPIAVSLAKRAKPSVKMTRQSKNKDVPIKMGLKDLNFGEIGSTIKDVVSTGMGMASGNPLSLLSIPNTIMSVLNTTNNAISDLNKFEPKQVVAKQVDMNESSNIKLVQNLKNYMPVVNTSNIPSAFGMEVKLPPLTRSESVHNGRKITTISGGVALNGLRFGPPGYNLSTLYLGLTSLVHPQVSALFGSRVASLASIFQQWRLVSGNLQYINQVGTNVTGSVVLSILDGTNVSGSTLITDVSQRDFYTQSAVYSQATLSFPGSDNFMWCGMNGGPDPIKFYAQQRIEIYTTGNTGGTFADVVGFPLFTFTLEFRSAAEANFNFLKLTKSDLHVNWISNYIGFDQINHIKCVKLLLRKFVDVGKLKANSRQEALINLIVSNPRDAPFMDQRYRELNHKTFTEREITKIVEMMKHHVRLSFELYTMFKEECLKDISHDITKLVKDHGPQILTNLLCYFFERHASLYLSTHSFDTNNIGEVFDDFVEYVLEILTTVILQSEPDVIDEDLFDTSDEESKKSRTSIKHETSDEDEDIYERFIPNVGNMKTA